MPSITGPEVVAVPPAADPTTLLPGNSPLLKLVPATADETRQASMLNGRMWSGPLALPDYLRREEHLARQALSKEGGLTAFVLVDSSKPEGQRDILAACETLRKRALVAHGDGTVQDVVSHGIGCVFCRAEYRGRGYAQRMIKELRDVLERWQQEPGERACFNVLYSDIGKNFYAREGWLPFSSSHISLPVQTSRNDVRFPSVKPIHAEELYDLCQADEKLLRAGLARFGAASQKSRVALLPDVEVMQWHHARENFIASELLGRTPTTKGVQVGMRDGSRVWAIWTRTFQRDQAENTLHILRIVIEDEDCYMELHDDIVESNGHTNGKTNGHANGHGNGNGIGHANGHSNGLKDDRGSELKRVRLNSETREMHMVAVAACLHAAQLEAAEWKMSQVDLWNPSPTVLAAAKACHPEVEVIHRDTESIASLLWYGPKNPNDVEWVCNEKFGWC